MAGLELCEAQHPWLSSVHLGNTDITVVHRQWVALNFFYPVVNQLGVSTQWSQLSNDESMLIYFLIVTNYSNNTVEYSFVEADF